MKKTILVITLAMLVVLVVIQCSKEKDPSPKEQKMHMLTDGAWMVDKVHNNADGDITSLYATFAIAFSKSPFGNFEGDYYVAAGGRAFPDVYGHWRFNEDLSRLILDNGREMEISLSDKILTLRFSLAPTGGRMDGLSGDFTFTLVRK
ncbi:MAG TPA: hypothetical protein VGD40_10345 [Chryseosolibacter sp.]